MKKIKWIFVVLMLLCTLLYWLSLSDVERTLEPWALRKSVLYYTGIMSFFAMTLGMILAMRLRMIENWLGGLDKHYRLHKWLGITAALFALAHWLSKKYKWLVELGVYEQSAFKTPAGTRDFFQHTNFFKPLENLAEDLGEWALYALIALAVLALWKKFPYRYFFKTHRILAVIYLILAFHTLILFGKMDWQTPIGVLVGALLVLGPPAACASLLQRIGVTHRASGRISEITLHADGKVTQVEVTLTTPWEGHKEGQFAFVTFHQKEGHHPFTLSSSWKNDARLSFHIKQLGDYTRTLSRTLKVGDPVTVEGPYGKFDFSDYPGPQVWIAGGIGITPFLSRLEKLAHEPDQHKERITLFYSARDSDQALIDYVAELANKANVNLHLSVSGRHPPVTAQTIRGVIPDLQDRTVWFCGASGFGESIKKGLKELGVPDHRFHQELFEMR
ncbi:ferredoxin reductase family protein [Zwartia vadi]|uniref:ferredoxin reductase family protein n=1 Tax=Zwartia vadi TaxID=3058168 RepID=UPI0025B6040D|nr:ferric reductase-like transmembrane domain-containing protein [Zwartia vadi]MDN3988353.1 ferric reductase-like transmembrane domain-containing protein [Zwartia vadi]